MLVHATVLLVLLFFVCFVLGGIFFIDLDIDNFINIFWLLFNNCPLLSLPHPYLLSDIFASTPPYKGFILWGWFLWLKAIYATIGLKVFTVAWCGHQWVQNWRLWFLSPWICQQQIVQQWRVGNPKPLFQPCLTVKGAMFCRCSVGVASAVCDFLITSAASCIDDILQPFSLPVSSYVLPTSSSWWSLSLRGDDISILFRTECSSVMYSQHLWAWVSVFTSFAGKRLLWLRAGIPFICGPTV